MVFNPIFDQSRFDLFKGIFLSYIFRNKGGMSSNRHMYILNHNFNRIYKSYYANSFYPNYLYASILKR